MIAESVDFSFSLNLTSAAECRIGQWNLEVTLFCGTALA